MNLKTRKRWSLVLLLVWLPLYIVGAWWLLAWIDDRFGRLPVWLELLLYIVLAFAWVLPFKRVFMGVGRGEE
ncbi:MAG: DUF2842 domain-containing protein [Paracoccus sp. (in: a-proteobacteria)]|uniref:DUF2842 domain-containing protein n=1 Tax=Paracoccus sp. TaxID=267 RepID=UPI0026DF1CA8|nr:DUF2842 domain-containing protein [Paracoccus sp. (in: a-proteobacteria)]MDO5621951.1 DUF2842 domain-containing protein [Paracoccus sp. (in: a-proteobacteria)]